MPNKPRKSTFWQISLLFTSGSVLGCHGGFADASAEQESTVAAEVYQDRRIVRGARLGVSETGPKELCNCVTVIVNMNWNVWDEKRYTDHIPTALGTTTSPSIPTTYRQPLPTTYRPLVIFTDHIQTAFTDNIQKSENRGPCGFQHFAWTRLCHLTASVRQNWAWSNYRLCPAPTLTRIWGSEKKVFFCSTLEWRAGYSIVELKSQDLFLLKNETEFFRKPINFADSSEAIWPGLVLSCSCKEYNNWNSFFAIIMGLNNVAVSRLSQTWEVCTRSTAWWAIGEMHGGSQAL